MYHQRITHIVVSTDSVLRQRNKLSTAPTPHTSNTSALQDVLTASKHLLRYPYHPHHKSSYMGLQRFAIINIVPITDTMMKQCELSKFKGNRRRCRWCNRLLTGKQKRWCSQECSGTAAGEHWFSWSRKYVRLRDGQRCTTCGSRKQLEVNHIIQANGTHSKASCLHHTDNLETLCKKCHSEITRKQRNERNN